MIINPNTIDILNSLANNPNVSDNSKYLYQNMIKYVKYDNEFFKKYYENNCNINELKNISYKLKTLESLIKELTINVSFIKLNYSVRKIIYIFSIIEIYLMDDIPSIFYKKFKEKEILIDNIDFINLNVEEIDIIFENIYLKYDLIKKIFEQYNIEGLARFELINNKIKKIHNNNIFDLYLNNSLDLNFILKITSNDADIQKYKSDYISRLVLKKIKNHNQNNIE